jgi:hypothetical protein
LNAGCRVTSIQKFLGHKRLNSTMIYARVHDLGVLLNMPYFTPPSWRSVEPPRQVPHELNSLAGQHLFTLASSYIQPPHLVLSE